MAVNMQKKSAGNEAAAPKAAAATKFSVMLGNQCQRYILQGETPEDSRMFIAGKEYDVTAAERKALFQLADDKGVRYFYDALFIKQREKRRRDALARVNAQRDGRGEIDTSEEDRVLTDEEGNPLGEEEGGTDGEVVEV